VTQAEPLRDVDEVRSHWWPRPGWVPGRLFYTWHLTFAGAEQLHRLADTYQQRLAELPGLNPVPLQWLHLTMQGVGWVDETPDRAVAAVVDSVSERLHNLSTFDITFYRPVVIREAIVLPPEPTAPLHSLRHAMREGISKALGPQAVHDGPQDASGYRPHVSIAYVSSDGVSSPYRSALAVPTAPAVVRVEEVALIAQERILDPQWLYRWSTVARAQLV
jgi:2'-5' RNA ligase